MIPPTAKPTGAASAPVLYLHPKSHMMFKEIIPLSLPALIDRIPVPVLGRFESEVTDDEIRGARIILMDLHWYLSLPAALRLAQRLKRINPHVIIIVGGLTASVFASQIVAHSPIDFVIRGDAEEPLPALVLALLEGGEVTDVSNLVHREFATPWNFALTAEILDSLNLFECEFFPSFYRGLLDFHSRPLSRPFSTHPFFLPMRGCPLGCKGCIGADDVQQRYFRRQHVQRSASRLNDDLEQVSDHPYWRYLNFFHDLLSLRPIEDIRIIFNRTYDLTIYYEAARLPSGEALELLLSSFKGGIVQFCLDQYHGTSSILVDTDELMHRLDQTKSHGTYSTRVTYSESIAKIDPVYCRALKSVVKATGTRPLDGGYWFSNYPSADEDGNGRDDEFQLYAANKGRTFTGMNLAVRCGLRLQRTFPKLVHNLGERFLRHSAYSSNL
jgi:hypothetical protein